MLTGGGVNHSGGGVLGDGSCGDVSVCRIAGSGSGGGGGCGGCGGVCLLEASLGGGGGGSQCVS
jgi:hypothetical protein